MHKALHKSQELFTATWGEISTFWGINKVMGQLYALLFASDKPLTLDDMCERLQISRGNASMNIRALKTWGVIRKVRVQGDRKDYYELDEDTGKIMTRFVRERKRRELEPALETMRRSAVLLRMAIPAMKNGERKQAQIFLKRIENMLMVSESINTLLERFIHGESISINQLKTIPIAWKKGA